MGGIAQVVGSDDDARPILVVVDLRDEVEGGADETAFEQVTGIRQPRDLAWFAAGHIGDDDRTAGCIVGGGAVFREREGPVREGEIVGGPGEEGDVIPAEEIHLLAAVRLAELAKQGRGVGVGDIEDLQASELIEEVKPVARDPPDVGLSDFAVPR